MRFRWLVVVVGAASVVFAACEATEDDAGESPDGGARAVVPHEASADTATGLRDATSADASTATSDAGTDAPLTPAAAPQLAKTWPDAGVCRPFVALTTSTPGTTVHYTTDGTTPTPASDAYAEPIPIPPDVPLEIRAIAAGGGYEPSEVVVETFQWSLKAPSPPAPSFDPPATTRDAGFSLLLEALTAAPHTVCFTLDAGVPTCAPSPCACGESCSSARGCASGSAYEGPIPLDAPVDGGDVVVMALTCPSSGSSSAVVSQSYTFAP